MLARYGRAVDKRNALSGEAERRRTAAESHREVAFQERHRLDVLAASAELVQYLIDELSKKGVAEMEAMLTSAVDAAFAGRGYKIRIDVEDHGKDKKAEFVLLKEDGVGRVRESELASNGDGLSAIIAFVTRVFFVVRFGRSRVLFDDESLKELSPRYAAGMAQFMKTVIEELGFVSVIITHARTQFLPYADRVYYVEEGGIIRETTAQEVLAMDIEEDGVGKAHQDELLEDARRRTS